ncbi:MAG: aconitate hydratase 1 [Betaproteobacteria bacterium]|nr:aconitate hydratase 1 [Betaproteobacteria bacterium]
MTSSLSTACKRDIDLGNGRRGSVYSLPALETATATKLSRLPVSIRVVLESLLRNCDGRLVQEEQVRDLARWQPDAPRENELPFVVGRVVLNCAAGIPLLGDLTALRDAMKRAGRSPGLVQPKVPLDMTLDHTLTVDYHGTADALQKNMQLEIERNFERFSFVKWATQAYEGIRLIPPGFGILHQINLEFFAPGLLAKDGVHFPDTLVGTDSHTCMIAGLGTVGWGVGGIEALTAVLGQPVYILTPDVIGVHVTGQLRAGVTSTDMVLHVTEMLRKAKVVGKFVEFFGDGIANLTVPDRATIANMAPEYGATVGFFPVDPQTLKYLQQTGRPADQIAATEAYYRHQGLFGPVRAGDVDYTSTLPLDLAALTPNVAGPNRPQDRIGLAELKSQFVAVLAKPIADGGYNKAPATPAKEGPRDGDVVIAAITSCTNTSNPGVMLAAGMVAKKAVERGLKVKPWVKTSLAPGSRVVSEYLNATGLQRYLDDLGFMLAGYSCTTCFGASGPIDAALEKSINDNDVVACAVLSGNRNFEARIHAAVRAAFLASPPLVVAFALAGRVNIDLATEPLGHDPAGTPIYLKDLWPTQEELSAALDAAVSPAHYQKIYGMDFEAAHPQWKAIARGTGETYAWTAGSTYIKEPPFLDARYTGSSLRDIRGARALAILGDSITTDHISPISSIRANSTAGSYLQTLGVAPKDFNNYGARRMNHDVMMRGAFANVRLRNQIVPGVEGGYTKHQPDGEQMTMYDAAMRYDSEAVPLIVIAGEEYGTGSARDWAAKGTRLLGVRAVIANSFERIHRSNLVGMGVLPCQLPAGLTADSLGLKGDETYELTGLDDQAKPRQALTLVVRRANASEERVPLTLRLDTPAEVDYVRCGGILPYVLTELTA